MPAKTDLTVTPYTPRRGQLTKDNITQFVNLEFNALALTVTDLVRGAVQVAYEAPLNPVKGMVRYADGTSWNPGSGEGLYVYKSAWTFIV